MQTKIIATIGPKSESPEVLKALVREGMDVARMNFSHCTHEEYDSRVVHLRKFSKVLKREVKILQDLKGPRIRVGELPADGLRLKDGEEICFSTDKKNSAGCIFMDDPHIHLDLKSGDPIYLANGAMETEVKKIVGRKIFCRVVRGGVLHSRKAVNAPHTKLTTSGLTKKDIDDVKFGLRRGVDYVAMSFVQSAKDVEHLRKLVGNKAKIISKIESAVGLGNIEEIVKASDAIMIARGDLGVEMPMEKIPFIQKHLTQLAIWHNKGVIAATQMMSSMIEHDHPTRAEVSDIANAVWDGVDAVMLSDETAAGRYPIEAIKAMAKVVREARSSFYQKNRL